jgi:hypothetical protein
MIGKRYLLNQFITLEVQHKGGLRMISMFNSFLFLQKSQTYFSAQTCLEYFIQC